MRSARQRGISLAEIAVVVGILAILMAVATPAYFRYRGRQAVNTAAETLEGLLTRAREEATSTGFPLSKDLLASGVPTAALTGKFGADGNLAVRLRKRYRSGQAAQVILSRDLSPGHSVEMEVAGLGALDLDAQTDLEGVFFEVLLKTEAATAVLAVIPIDVNGEMVLHAKSAEGALRLSSGEYSRATTVTRRGVITPDRR